MVQATFYPEQGVAHTYLLHPPGGVVGGDTLSININVQPYALCSINNARGDKILSVSRGTHANADIDGCTRGLLEWLPQENIFS